MHAFRQWMHAFRQCMRLCRGMRSGSKKLNYFLKNYARAVGRSILSYIIYLFGSCDRGVLKIVINKLKITSERIQFLVKLNVFGVQLLNMSSLKVLLKVMKSKQLS